MATGWNFMIQRATTGEWLDWDLPLNLSSLEWQLSGPGSLRGSVAPDIGGLRGSDGRLLIEEWGTLIYAEADGQIRWGGIIISSSFKGEEWDIEAAGFSTYPHGMPYEGEYSVIGVDAFDVAVEIWRSLQSNADSNLGMVVTGSRTGALLGTSAVAAVTSAKLTAASNIADRLPGDDTNPIYEDWTWQGCPAEVSQYHQELLDQWNREVSDQWAWLTSYLNANVADSSPETEAALLLWSRHVSGLPVDANFDYPGQSDGDVQQSNALMALWNANRDPKVWLTQWQDWNKGLSTEATAAAPFTLLWWEHPDCGEELDNLAKQVPYDYTEAHSWADPVARDTIIHEYRVHYPRSGRRRDDLAFIQGDNITNVVSLESDADQYANVVEGLGAGEGRAMIKRQTARSDGRLRRVYTYADKGVTDPRLLDAVIAQELADRTGEVKITSIDVVDHPNAAIGSWEVGDDILVRADLPWMGEVEIWCRITGWELTGESTATLTLARSDSFRYGGVTA